MRKLTLLLVTMAITCYGSAQQVTLLSPNRLIQLKVDIQNTVSYQIHYKNKPAILPSSLSFKLKEPAVELKNFAVIKIDSSAFDQTWKPVWGEYGSIRDRHKELRLQLKDKSGSDILLVVVFRVFDEGVGFRYEFPQQEKLNHFIVEAENSQFHLAGDHKTFCIPDDYSGFDN